MKIIDVHAHYVAREVLDIFRTADGERLGVSILKDANGKDVLVVGGRPTNQPIPPGITADDDRIAHMDATGIDIQLLSPWMQLHGYNLDGTKGKDLCRLQNDAIAELIRRHPQRFLGAATVPLQDVGLAVEELERVSAMGFKAVQIGTSFGSANLNDASLDRFWQAVVSLDLLVLLHPLTVPEARHLREYLLDLLVGFPAETTHAAGVILFYGLFERYPELKISLPHGGGFLPYQIGRMQRGLEVLGDRAPARLDVAQSASRFFFDSILHDSRSLAFLIDRVGASHVLLGSDFPFNLGDLDPLKCLDSLSDLDDKERSLIAGSTAESLLGMELE